MYIYQWSFTFIKIFIYKVTLDFKYYLINFILDKNVSEGIQVTSSSREKITTCPNNETLKSHILIIDPNS